MGPTLWSSALIVLTDRRICPRIELDHSVLLLHRLDDGHHKASTWSRLKSTAAADGDALLLLPSSPSSSRDGMVKLDDRELANFGQHSRFDDLPLDAPFVPFNIDLHRDGALYFLSSSPTPGKGNQGDSSWSTYHRRRRWRDRGRSVPSWRNEWINCGRGPFRSLTGRMKTPGSRTRPSPCKMTSRCWCHRWWPSSWRCSRLSKLCSFFSFIYLNFLKDFVFDDGSLTDRRCVFRDFQSCKNPQK